MVAYTFHLHGALRWPHGTREEQSRFSVRPGRNVAGANFSTSHQQECYAMDLCNTHLPRLR